MMKNTLCWTEIPVIKLDRAIAFYSAVLGAKVPKETAEPGIEYGLLPWTDGAASGSLHLATGNEPSLKGPLIYLSVEGRLDDAIRMTAEKGGRIVEGKHQIGPHGFRAVIVDSEGNRLALHSMKP
ncbi:MAG: VOC family protein [Opitutaceae bacterium]|nr:VOC family protein [Opitutaceae bacterium]